MLGFKNKISNIQAPIGCAQVERIDELIKKKRDIFFSYFDYFKKYDSLKMNPVPSEKNTYYGYWMPSIVFDKSINFNREELLSELRKITRWRFFFYPLS
jgi:perosamine synthetase